METIRVAAGIVGLALPTLLALAIIILVFQGKINLEFLIGDSEGDASMSRFQLLIFTFVVAMSFLYRHPGDAMQDAFKAAADNMLSQKRAVTLRDYPELVEWKHTE